VALLSGARSPRQPQPPDADLKQNHSSLRRMKKIDYDGYRFPPAIIQAGGLVAFFDSL
jgi:hypothetical protein